MAISAKSGTSLSLFSENYNINFCFLINFRRWVAVFCSLPSPCPCLPKWRSGCARSQDLVDPQEESTGLLLPEGAQERASKLFPKLIFLQETQTFQGWPQITLWDASAYFRLMSPTNTVLKMFLVLNTGLQWCETLMNETLEKRHGAAGSYLENAGGKRESTEILIKWQNFCTCVLLQKYSKFLVSSADLKQMWKYYLAPAVFNFYFYLSFLNYFPGKVHTVSISLLSFSFSELCGLWSTSESVCQRLKALIPHPFEKLIW